MFLPQSALDNDVCAPRDPSHDLTWIISNNTQFQDYSRFRLIKAGNNHSPWRNDQGFLGFCGFSEVRNTVKTCSKVQAWVNSIKM